MAIHAAMVDRMDREIGRVCRATRRHGRYWIARSSSSFGQRGEPPRSWSATTGMTRPPSRARAATYLCLGPGWSSAANTPFRRHKTWVHEGGIATPLIAHWPGGIPLAASCAATPGHVVDIVPTVLEMVGGNPLEETAADPAAAGPEPCRGVARGSRIERDTLWWLHEGNRAIRVADWKLVAARDDPWELYDVRDDRAESQNLAQERPEKATELDALWERTASGDESTGSRDRSEAEPE